ncbi:MAG: hypothetical protein DCC75_05290 [Proteobacteria bacterium]|nr:MAG: hypothetical protein DCC75_05290 [Pseudomonadota bacterium]
MISPTLRSRGMLAVFTGTALSILGLTASNKPGPGAEARAGSVPPAAGQVDHDALDPVRRGDLILQKGSKGGAVSSLQTMLGLKPDGDFGKRTDAELRSFQEALGLESDGKVGVDTMVALDRRRAEQLGIEPSRQEADLNQLKMPGADSGRDAMSYPTLSRGDRGEVVRTLKVALNKLGCKPPLNEKNPDFDRLTEDAVKRFQINAQKEYPHLKEEHGGKGTGIVTPKTWLYIHTALSKRAGLFDGAAEVWEDLFAPRDPPSGPATAGTFDRAFSMTKRFEGKRSTDPKDRGNPNGSATYQGLRQYTMDVYCRDHKLPRIDLRKQNPPEALVKEIYRERYWSVCEQMGLPECLAITYYDCRILFGHRGAACMLQRALGVTIDGKIGTESLEALRGQDPAYITMALTSQRFRLIDILCKMYPTNKRFEKGWEKRAQECAIASGVLVRAAPLIGRTDTLDEVAPLTNEEVWGVLASAKRELGFAPTGQSDVEFFKFLLESDPSGD